MSSSEVFVLVVFFGGVAFLAAVAIAALFGVL